jgi:beta-galactosidase/beta-glucuronidase
MKLKDAIKTLPLFNRKRSFHQLYTPWGEQLDTKNVLNEYPRPQLKRESYINLNGYWYYSITKKPIKPKQYEGMILVPFSPESVLSKVNKQLLPGEYLWYEKKIYLDEIEANKRCLLHFGAVDQYLEVFINEKKVKEHMGGYLPVSMDITKQLKKGENIITLKVMDSSDTSYHSRGKQKLNRGGMFYTAQSGIWQTVWMEWVSWEYIKSMELTPNIDDSSINIKINLNKLNVPSKNECFIIKIFDNENLIQTVTSYDKKFKIPIQNPKYWSPENPFLYNLEINYGEDNIRSYFAMRKFEIKKDKDGYARIFLNNEPYFQNGVLDQGYWPDGLYTAPSDEAMIFDIQKAKELGFNMIRKHIKIEPLRWYYHCDRLGMIVWQDMVNGGGKYNTFFVGYLPTLFPKLADFIKDKYYLIHARKSKEGRKEWLLECKNTIKHLYNCPSIAVWVPFNEGWGQFDANNAVKIIKSLDQTRLVDHASGWFDQQGGDFKSIHDYFHKLDIVKDKRAVVLSEFGGYACYLPLHSYSNRIYGYRIYKNKKELNKAYQELYNKEIKELIKKGLSATVYTQLSDVEDEVNGLYTYDRKIRKIDVVNKLK